MKYWFIIHSLPAYNAHNDYIGKEKKRAGKIENVKKGDKIVYYATGDSVIVGTFDVITSKKEWTDDEHWKGPHICMKIKPRKLAKAPHYIRIQDLLRQIETPLSIFRDRKFKGIKFKDRTSVEITEKDFESIEKYIKSCKSTEPELFRGRANDENLGEPLDLELCSNIRTGGCGFIRSLYGQDKRS